MNGDCRGAWRKSTNQHILVQTLFHMNVFLKLQGLVCPTQQHRSTTDHVLCWVAQEGCFEFTVCLSVAPQFKCRPVTIKQHKLQLQLLQHRKPCQCNKAQIKFKGNRCYMLRSFHRYSCGQGQHCRSHKAKNTYFAQTDLAMMPRTSSSDKPSKHQKGDQREEARTRVSVGSTLGLNDMQKL